MFIRDCGRNSVCFQNISPQTSYLFLISFYAYIKRIIRILHTCYLDYLFLPVYFILAQFTAKITVELKFIYFFRVIYQMNYVRTHVRYLDNLFLPAYSILARLTAKNCCGICAVELKNQWQY